MSCFTLHETKSESSINIEAWSGNAIAGTCLCLTDDYDSNPPQFAYLENINVKPSFRRQGIGGLMLDKAITWARDELGAKTLTGALSPETEERRGDLIRFYAAHGITCFDNSLHRDLQE